MGYWSGDASCPKSKGKGKSPKGSGKGKGSGDAKPRTVFFAVRENETAEEHTALMAYRRPFNIFGAVPPPTELQQGEIVSSPEEEDKWSLVASSHVREGQSVSQEGLDMMMLVSALGVSEYREDRGEVLSIEGPTSSTTPSEPPAEVQARAARPQEPDPRPHREPVQWTSHETSPSQVSPASATTKPTNKKPACLHYNVTGQGSNAFYKVKKCKDCGTILERTPVGSADSRSMTSETSSAPGCNHHRVSWHGTNGFRWKRTCLQCGEVRSGPVNGGKSSGKGSSPSTASNETSSTTRPTTSSRKMTSEEILRVRGLFNHSLDLKSEGQGEGFTLTDHELVDLLRMCENIVLGRPAHEGQDYTPTEPAGSGTQTPSLPTRTPTSQAIWTDPPTPDPSTPPAHAHSLQQEGRRTISFGLYKGQTQYEAWNDQGYVRWLLAKSKPENLPRL